jgi:predicted nucleic acid-binding protein
MTQPLPKVFPDTNVLLAAVLREPGTSEAARALISSTEEEFWTSELVRLETISRLWRHSRRSLGPTGRAALVADAATIFNGSEARQPILPEIIAAAFTITDQVRGIHAMDALHAATALYVDAELVTLEASTKPLFFVPGLRVRSLLDGGISAAPTARARH